MLKIKKDGKRGKEIDSKVVGGRGSHEQYKLCFERAKGGENFKGFLADLGRED